MYGVPEINIFINDKKFRNCHRHVTSIEDAVKAPREQPATPDLKHCLDAVSIGFAEYLDVLGPRPTYWEEMPVGRPLDERE